jgi:two-component system, chemotaxis family, CheB/CheR fusion protein
MKKYTPFAYLAIWLCLAGCTSTKALEEIKKKNQSLEDQLIRSNKEIQELRENVQSLKDELKLQKEETQKANNEVAALGQKYDAQTQQLTQQEVKAKEKEKENALLKTQQNDLVLSYEEKITFLTTENEQLRRRKGKTKKIISKKN